MLHLWLTIVMGLHAHYVNVVNLTPKTVGSVGDSPVTRIISKGVFRAVSEEGHLIMDPIYWLTRDALAVQTYATIVRPRMLERVPREVR